MLFTKDQWVFLILSVVAIYYPNASAWTLHFTDDFFVSDAFRDVPNWCRPLKSFVIVYNLAFDVIAIAGINLFYQPWDDSNTTQNSAFVTFWLAITMYKLWEWTVLSRISFALALLWLVLGWALMIAAGALTLDAATGYFGYTAGAFFLLIVLAWTCWLFVSYKWYSKYDPNAMPMTNVQEGTPLCQTASVEIQSMQTAATASSHRNGGGMRKSKV